MGSDYLCNLLVPGAAKSGTTALHEILDHHPQIRMSSLKEPQFFSIDDRYQHGPELHNSMFEADDPSIRYFGESSTSYLVWPEALERIESALHRPKIIMLLRDPLSRTVSHYRWRYRLGLEKRDIITALREDGYRIDPEGPGRFGYPAAYLRYSSYATYCPMWLEAFGDENCLLIASHELKRDFANTASRLAKFLGLASTDGLQPQYVYRTDTLSRRPTPGFSRAASLIPASLKLSRHYETLRERVLSALAPTPPATIPPDAERFLQEVLADDIAYYNNLFCAT